MNKYTSSYPLRLKFESTNYILVALTASDCPDSKPFLKDIDPQLRQLLTRQNKIVSQKNSYHDNTQLYGVTTKDITLVDYFKFTSSTLNNFKTEIDAFDPRIAKSAKKFVPCLYLVKKTEFEDPTKKELKMIPYDADTSSIVLADLFSWIKTITAQKICCECGHFIVGNEDDTKRSDGMCILCNHKKMSQEDEKKTNVKKAYAHILEQMPNEVKKEIRNIFVENDGTTLVVNGIKMVFTKTIQSIEITDDQIVLIFNKKK